MLNKLNAKLAEIRRQKEQATANLNAISGAEQVLLQLINECRTENKQESEVKPDEAAEN